MFIAAAIVSVLLAAALAGSANAKLTKNPMIIEGIVKKVGWPEDRLWVLAGLELAGAAGLIIGLFWAPLGIAAAVGVVLYFVGAIISHVRVRDTSVASLGPAAGLLVFAAVALALRVASA